MNTLLLDRTLWDLCTDVSGDIAMATDPYALAQDAASAIKLFKGELWYNTDPGVPYFPEILGAAPPLQLMKAKFQDAAKTVPEVVTAQAFISSVVGRTVKGQVQTTSSKTGLTSTVIF